MIILLLVIAVIVLSCVVYSLKRRIDYLESGRPIPLKK